jgi:hypothetical protein
MGDLWRSQPMQLVQLFINLEAAHDTVDELGELGLVQFRDVREKNALVFGGRSDAKVLVRFRACMLTYPFFCIAKSYRQCFPT